MEYIFWIRFQIRVIFVSVKVELLQASSSSAIIGMASLTILAERTRDKVYVRSTFFCQITTIIKVCLAFVFRIQTL